MATTASAPLLDQNVSKFISKTHKILINGKWVEAASGKTFPTYNPATGDVLSRVAEGDQEDVNRAVKVARTAFDSGPWGKITPSERGRMIWKLGDLIEKHLEEFAQLESLDNGKPLTVARVADVPLAADMFRYMAGWATKIEGNTIPISSGGGKTQFLAYTLREPVGVVAQIIPWNFPLLMAAWKLGPALATGCTVVLKPAEQTPLSALLLGELIAEAGIPDGVVNIVPGYGETAGAALSSHPEVDKVAFTGSTEVGKLILKAAAGNLKKVSLELGGKSPNIILDDADVDSAIPGAASAIFFNHGQCCCAGSRLFVENEIFDKVVEGVAKYASDIRVGPGMDPSSDMGPLVSEEQLNRVCGYLESGLSEGAKAVTGGSREGNQRLLREAHGPRQHQRKNESGARRDFRPRGHRDSLPQHRGNRRASQQLQLRPGSRRVDPRHQESPQTREPAARRNGVDQLLQRVRRRAALRRIQRIRLGPRNGPRSPRAIHRGQGRLHADLVKRRTTSLTSN